jgi:xanthine dehydrogenase accessory factor
MRDTVHELLQALLAQRPAVYCRLVETRGSTPQKAGALMLVFADGSQAGTLGGGCVEAEVKRRALATLTTGQPEVARFQLDHDYGWDDGLICGGRMQVLVEPILGRDVCPYLQQFAELVDRGQGATEAIVFEDGPAELPAAASFLFDGAGQVVVQVGTPDPVPDWLREQLRPLSERPRPYAARGVAFLPVLPRCRLLIVGGGHVGKAVADLAADLDFDVWVADDRAEYVAAERFPHASQRLNGPIDQILPALDVDSNTYCLIVTRGHNHDEEALYHLVRRNARYVGMIGSRRKIKMIFEDLLSEGVPQDCLDRVYAPLGIDIGSQTVAEIAVSICAELVRVPGRPASPP